MRTFSKLLAVTALAGALGATVIATTPAEAARGGWHNGGGAHASVRGGDVRGSFANRGGFRGGFNRGGFANRGGFGGRGYWHGGYWRGGRWFGGFWGPTVAIGVGYPGNSCYNYYGYYPGYCGYPAYYGPAYYGPTFVGGFGFGGFGGGDRDFRGGDRGDGRGGFRHR